MRFLPLISFILLFAPGVAEGAPPLIAIMEAVRADEWTKAEELARTTDEVAEDIVTWRRLRAGEGSFEEAHEFLTRNGDWPGLGRIRVRAEGLINSNVAPEAVIHFFSENQPATGAGGVWLTRAYAAVGRQGDAEAQAVLTWRTLPLDSAGHAYLLNNYGTLLAHHHTERLDAMLWMGADDSANLMLNLVPAGWRALAVARMALRKQGKGVDKLIAAVPEDLADDPGLAWERFNWRVKKGRAEDAIALLDERSIGHSSLGRPERWAGWRRAFAHRMMREGRNELAYRLAANHFMSEGTSFAELEWLAGFIALRKLNEPEVALAHFRRFGASVETPISLGRAGYWEGRALQALGRDDEAEKAYLSAAEHQTSFYGQLAAERAGLPMDSSLSGTETFPDWSDAPFAGSSALKAGMMFMDAGEQDLARWFLTHLAKSADARGQAQLAGLAYARGETHIALRIAKVAARQGNILPRAYFPVTEIAEADHPVPPELVLAIARRESEFDIDVTSGAGARGLMQLMPRTARAVAASINVDYSPTALVSDPGYNASLGAGYLASLIEEFGPNYVLVAAAYNAGPSRVRRWIEEQGDPRSAGVDVVDWIEHIPFNETRNYVMRVMESLDIYRARLEGMPQTISLSRKLKAF